MRAMEIFPMLKPEENAGKSGTEANEVNKGGIYELFSKIS